MRMGMGPVPDCRGEQSERTGRLFAAAQQQGAHLLQLPLQLQRTPAPVVALVPVGPQAHRRLCIL